MYPRAGYRVDTTIRFQTYLLLERFKTSTVNYD